jgi:hypothetical protein
MSYEDYQKRKWIVTERGDEARCQEGDPVAFEGSPDDVMIVCKDVKPYGAGRYILESHTIASQTANEYEISMVPGIKRRINFQAQGGVITESWCADDHGSPPDGG